MAKFSQNFSSLALEDLHAHVEARAAEGWRYVQTLAVNTERGVDLVYSFMKDGVLDNKVIRDVPRDAQVPSITDVFLEAFVFENEIHDLFGIHVEGIAIDFGGNFYHLSQKEPMTIVSPELAAAREKAKKVAAAKAAKEAAARESNKAAAASAANVEFLAEHPESKAEKKTGHIIEPPTDDELDAKLAGMDPEKVARVKAAMAAKAKKAAEAAAAAKAAAAAQKAAELEEKLAGMDPEKAAKVRAAMEAKAKKEAAAAAAKEGE